MRAMNPTETELYQKTLSCIHCGFCLPACPAYQTSPRESLAPRGQVYNVRAMLEGRLLLSDGLADEIYDCLACRGCESVCPAGVPVGAIIEGARALITEERKEGLVERSMKRLLLSGVVAHPKRLAVLMALQRFYEATGLRRLAQSLLELTSPTLAARERLMPMLPPRVSLPELFPAKGNKRKRVALFTGCIASHYFGDVNEATARVLQRNGFEVVVPSDQVCCGALHLHNGLAGTGRRLALENIEVFDRAKVDAIVVNAAGCGAALTEYGELLHGNDGARAFTGKVADISAFLVREGFEPPTRPLPGASLRVAYDAPCHLFHAQGIREEPPRLLSEIPGVTLVPYRDSERCCGSAGIYNVTHYDMSMEVLASKMEAIAKARPDVIVTGNPGCHIQLSEGVRRSGLQSEVVHPAVLLERAYRSGDEE
jgi:glycolate oxidase iron-sulfur subunit